MNQSILLILSTVLPVFIIILIGFFIGKKKQIDTQPIVDLIIYITSPCLILTSMVSSKLEGHQFSMIFIAAALIILIQASLVYFILKIRKSDKKGLYLPMVIGNTGFLGYPLALFAFGQAGLSGAIVYDVTSSLFLYSIGIYLISHKNSFVEIFKTPLVYAAVIGICFSIFHVNIPSAIFTPLQMIGTITIPLALLILGYQLTKFKVQSYLKVTFASLFKILGGLLIAFFIATLLGITGVPRSIILLQSAMPSAVMSMILTHKYGRDPEIVSSIVFLGTLISIITIPIILFFI